MDGVNKKIFRHGHKHEWCPKKIVEGCSGHGNGHCCRQGHEWFWYNNVDTNLMSH